jgi:glycosyltransferase involved in cell wall biosynthesis
MPRVSVITPFYNSGRWLRETAESVMRQTFTDWEWILVDDGSEDDSCHVLESYLEDRRVRLIQHPHVGRPAILRNKALAEAAGELVAFLDSDDVWVENRIDLGLQALETHSDRHLVYGAAYDMRADGTVFRKRSIVRYPDHEFLRSLILYGNFVPLGTTMMRHECYEVVGPMDESLDGSEDYDYWLRLAGRFRFFGLDEPLIYFRYHDKNLSWQERVILSTMRVADKCERLYPQFSAEIQKHRARILYSYGIWHLERGQFQMAREKFVVSMRRDPLSPWPYYMYLKTLWISIHDSLRR